MSVERTSVGKKRGAKIQPESANRKWLCYHVARTANNTEPYKKQHKATTSAGGKGVYREIALALLPKTSEENEKEVDAKISTVEKWVRKGKLALSTEQGLDEYCSWLNWREFMWWSYKHRKHDISAKSYGLRVVPDLMSEEWQTHLSYAQLAVHQWHQEHPEVPCIHVTPQPGVADDMDDARRIEAVQQGRAPLGHEAAIAEARERLSRNDSWIKYDYSVWRVEYKPRQSPIVWIPTPKRLEAAQEAERTAHKLPLTGRNVTPKSESSPEEFVEEHPKVMRLMISQPWGDELPIYVEYTEAESKSRMSPFIAKNHPDHTGLPGCRCTICSSTPR